VYKLPEFVKNIPVTERPRLVAEMRKYGTRYFATDFTAFESHFVPEIMDAVECQLYRWCLSNDLDSAFLCDTLMGHNKMRTRTGVRSEIVGRRMSGDMCTSLGNGFTNLMLAKFIVSEKGGHLAGFVEGDDGLFASSVELTAKDYASLGFTIKIEEVPNPCEASFCGMVFAESGEIIRNPISFLSKFGWTGSFINAGPRIMDELLRAKALSAIYETPQCPIVGVMARVALEKTSHVHPRFVSDGFHENLPDVVALPRFCPSVGTRVLFEKLYGISVPCQLAIEKQLYSSCDIVGLLDICPDAIQYASNYVEVT